jgi:hypothetical protein
MENLPLIFSCNILIPIYSPEKSQGRDALHSRSDKPMKIKKWNIGYDEDLMMGIIGYYY